jgi:hypothetical protein
LLIAKGKCGFFLRMIRSDIKGLTIKKGIKFKRERERERKRERERELNWVPLVHICNPSYLGG